MSKNIKYLQKIISKHVPSSDIYNLPVFVALDGLLSDNSRIERIMPRSFHVACVAQFFKNGKDSRAYRQPDLTERHISHIFAREYPFSLLFEFNQSVVGRFVGLAIVGGSGEDDGLKTRSYPGAL